MASYSRSSEMGHQKKNLSKDFNLNGRRHVFRGGKKEGLEMVEPEKMQKLLQKQPQGLVDQVFALQVEDQYESGIIMLR